MVINAAQCGKKVCNETEIK